MKDEVGIIDQLRHKPRVVAGVDRITEPRILAEGPDVLDRASREIVQGVDAMTVSEQLLGKMGADEAGTPCNQNPHVRAPCSQIQRGKSLTRETRATWLFRKRFRLAGQVGLGLRMVVTA